MIDCRGVKTKLGRFVDGELLPVEQVSVQAHIRECPYCRDELNALQALSTFLDRLSVPPVPERLAGGIMSLVREQKAEPWWATGLCGFWRDWPAAMRVAASATAAAACLIGLVLSSATSPSPSRTGSDVAWVGLASGAPLASAYLETSR